MIFPAGPMAAHAERRSTWAGRGVSGAQQTRSYDSLGNSGWQNLIDVINGGRNIAGTYSLSDAYSFSPWMQPSIHAFAGVVAARTFRVWHGKKQLDNHWLLDLMSRPNRDLKLSEFQLFYYSMALWRYAGEFFWQKEYGNDPVKPGQKRNAKARPTQLWIWHKDAVTPEVNQSTKEFLGWTLSYGGYRTFVDRDDMVHFPLYDPRKHNPKGPSRGTSLWQSKLLPMSNEIEQHRWGSEFYRRGLSAVVFIDKSASMDGDEVRQQVFMDKVKAKLGGKVQEPFVLGGDWNIQQVEPGQQSAQYVEGLDQNRKTVLSGNVPPVVLGGDAANYATAELQAQAWLIFDVIPAMTMAASCIDSGFVYDEPQTWTELSTDDIDVLQESKGKKIDRYVSLVSNGQMSPLAAGKQVGLDIDPNMPGADLVTISFSKIPIEIAAEGGSVSVSKDTTSGEPVLPGDVVPTGGDVAAPPPVPSNTEGQRTIRLRVNDDGNSRVRIVSRIRADGGDDLLQLLLKIVTKDTKKVRDKAKQFQLAAVEAGTKQIGQTLQLDTLLAIDNPRVVKFLEDRGNLIESVPEGVAQRIFEKTTGLIDQGTSPENISTIIKREFNILSDARAREIARNEVGSGLNGGRFMQMEEEGVDKREWLTSRDARVRPDHEVMDGEVVGIDEEYSNGLRFPQDPEGDASQTVNCRCVEYPRVGSYRSAACQQHIRQLAAAMIAQAAREADEHIARITKGRSLNALSEAERAQIDVIREEGNIDERTGYWRAVVSAKNVRQIERKMSDAMSTIIYSWRAPILSLLADRGIIK